MFPMRSSRSRGLPNVRTRPAESGRLSERRLDRPLSVEGDRLYVQMGDGVRVFDGSPRADP